MEQPDYTSSASDGMRLDLLELTWPVRPGPIEKLPTELLLNIAESLNPSDLCSLSCASRQLHDAAHAPLYTNITLRDTILVKS